ncbi:MAG: membrane protein [Tepidiforma sp.]|nr:MAG: membrane protein [Tepidiforma sp.]
MPPADPRAGAIYDLGYRAYDGPRLGRRAAVLSLYVFTLRAAFGIGRRPAAKVVPVLVTAFAFIPALIQLGVAALIGSRVEVVAPWNYLGFSEVPVALFCAGAAPEVFGRDLRYRTLALYFSRPLRRQDYALAKSAAFITALAVPTLGPLLLLVIGNGLASEDVPGYLAGHWRELPQSLAAGLLIAAVAGLGSLAIAVHAPRRAHATAAIAAWFLLTLPVAAIIVEVGGGAGRYAAWFSPFDLLYGAALAIFGREPGADSIQGAAGLPIATYLLLALLHAAAALALILRRFQRVQA